MPARIIKQLVTKTTGTITSFVADDYQVGTTLYLVAVNQLWELVEDATNTKTWVFVGYAVSGTAGSLATPTRTIGVTPLNASGPIALTTPSDVPVARFDFSNSYLPSSTAGVVAVRITALTPSIATFRLFNITGTAGGSGTGTEVTSAVIATSASANQQTVTSPNVQADVNFPISGTSQIYELRVTSAGNVTPGLIEVLTVIAT